jgi:hypothetical protein
VPPAWTWGGWTRPSGAGRSSLGGGVERWWFGRGCGGDPTGAGTVAIGLVVEELRRGTACRFTMAYNFHTRAAVSWYRTTELMKATSTHTKAASGPVRDTSDDGPPRSVWATRCLRGPRSAG